MGSVARAMMNMGFSRLILADPIAFESPAYFDTEARRMAWRASGLLDRLESAADRDAALAPFTLVAGTTSRPPEGHRVLDPGDLARAVAGHLADHPAGRAALLFGQEDIGLTREDMTRCHLLGAIPAALEYPSLNLAQAALVFLYELRRELVLAARVPDAASGQATPPAPVAGASGPAPGEGDPPGQHRMEAFYGRLEEALEAIGFFEGTTRPHMMRELRRIFNRALLTPREVAILEGITHRAAWTARRRG